MNRMLMLVLNTGCFVVLYLNSVLGVNVYNDNPKVCRTQVITKNSAFRDLEDCTVIEGNLKIYLFDFEPNSFPNLLEITGYLLLYRVSGLDNLSNVFPNLTVIRGQELMYNYALVVYEMSDLEDIGLPSLRVIKHGGVRIEKNMNLCYVSTVDWFKITHNAQADFFFKNNKFEAECVNKCPENCMKTILSNENKPRCWNADSCQKNLDCKCDYCMTNTRLCCHEFCIGGCTGPTIEDCISCKHFIHNDKCIRYCPPNTYMLKSRRCVTKDQCNQHKKEKLSENRHTHYLTLDIVDANNRTLRKECVPDCPENYTISKSGNDCEKCSGKCPKICRIYKKIDSISAAAELTGCTYIAGQIIIQIDGGSDIGLEFEKSFRAIEEVEYYIKIVRSYPLVSLHFFKNLKVIHGKVGMDRDSETDDENAKENRKYGLIVMDNQNLEELFLPEVAKNLKILNNKRVKFHFNRKLCEHKIRDFLTDAKLWKTEYNRTLNVNDVSTNGDLVPCNITKINLSVSDVFSNYVLLKWNKYIHLTDDRRLLGYILYYREVTSKHVDIFQGQDACSQSQWKKIDWDVNKKNKDKEMVGLIHSLTPWTMYAAYVKSLTVNTKKSAISNIIFVKTLSAQPSAPTNLEVKAEKENELFVSWDTPLKPNGDITHYKVYWKQGKLNREEFDERNYCLEKIVLDKPTKDEEKAEEEEEKQVKLNKDGCCTCPKFMKDVEQLKKNVQSRLKFENAIKDLVYVKNTKALSIDITKLGNVPGLSFTMSDITFGNISLSQHLFNPPNPKSNKSDVDKSKSIDTSKYIVDHSGIISFDKPEKSDGDVVNETDSDNVTCNDCSNSNDNEYIAMLAVVNGTNITLTNLGHFQPYNIKVLACQDTLENGEKYCSDKSNIALAFKRTLKSPTADRIDPSTIQFSVNDSGKVNITWDSPSDPNGLIVCFEIEYRPVHDVNGKVRKPCLTHTQYRENMGYVLTVTGHGNHSFRIRATSLAGPGTWTPDMFFHIKSPPEADILQGTIAGLIIGVVVFIIILVVVVHVAKRKFLRKQEPTTISINPGYMQTSDIYTPDEWEIDRDKVKLLDKRLGKGSFGMVWEGSATDILPSQKEPISVAVKTVNEDAGFYDKMIFLKEASTMKEFKCYHVVRLLGVVSIGQPALVIMELMTKGDLRNYLRLHRPDSEESTSYPPPSITEILQMVGEIADGMAYLADKKFVHRDLAARNCMVSENNVVKIGDFGMTRDIYETDYYKKAGRGLLPVRWMAPESLKDGLFSTMSDVWSLGVVLWEMATLAAQPYQGLSNEEVLKYVVNGEVMDKPEGCPDQLYVIMKCCWRYKHKERPTFKEIIEMIIPDLDPSFKDVSYFFSEENTKDGRELVYIVEEPPCNLDNLEARAYPEDLDDSVEYDTHDESTIPFIEHHTDRLNNQPRSSVLHLNNSEPCECVMLEELNSEGHRVSDKQNNCYHGDSKESSKSSNDSNRNGLLNRHVYRLPPTSSC